MYNAQKPNLDDLPTAGRLWRSTAIAAGAAALILVTVVWPSEYGIDPTGVGGLLGLTEMGEIKSQLAEEAEADRLMMEGQVGAHAQEVTAPTGAPVWKDEITFALEPGKASRSSW